MFDLYVRGWIRWIDICTRTVGFICIRFDLVLYGSIDISVRSIYMYAARFTIFVRFDLFVAVFDII